MKIQFSGPFSKLAKELDIELERPVSLRELVSRMPPRIAVLVSSGDVTDEEISAHVFFIRKGRLLRLDDTVGQEDIVEVALPATGG